MFLNNKAIIADIKRQHFVKITADLVWWTVLQHFGHQAPCTILHQ